MHFINLHTTPVRITHLDAQLTDVRHIIIHMMYSLNIEVQEQLETVTYISLASNISCESLARNCNETFYV